MSAPILAAQLAAGCANQQYSATEIAQALNNSPYANQSLKKAACNFGAAAQSESGGNSCASNGSNFGVLQLNAANLGGMTPNAYLNAPLQTQVDQWAKSVGNENTASYGYQQITEAVNSGGSLGTTLATPGMAAACFQFGPSICNNDVRALQGGGSCNGNGVRCINSSCQGGTASLDGNGQSICSWGSSIQNNINRYASTCNGASCTTSPLQGDFPTQPPAGAFDLDLS
jgi:hypothetical protein